MASTTGNAIELPYVLQNGVGNIPDADEVMAIADKCNDKIFVCTEATKPAAPYNGQIIIVTDSSTNIAMRVYLGSMWFVIPIAELV